LSHDDLTGTQLDVRAVDLANIIHALETAASSRRAPS